MVLFQNIASGDWRRMWTWQLETMIPEDLRKPWNTSISHGMWVHSTMVEHCIGQPRFSSFAFHAELFILPAVDIEVGIWRICPGILPGICRIYFAGVSVTFYVIVHITTWG